MSSFSSLLATIGGQPKAPQSNVGTAQREKQSEQVKKQNSVTNGASLTTGNAVAGVKRKSEEPEAASRPKAAKIEPDAAATRPVVAPSGRFQLSAKSGTAQRPSTAPQRPSPKPTSSSRPSSAIQKPASSCASTPSQQTATNGSVPVKRGYASILERAKAAQEVAKASGPTVITHKAVNKLSKRDRRKLAEEAKEQEQAAKRGKIALADRSRSGTPIAGRPGLQKKAQEISYKGTMKKAPEQPAYKGTMHAAGTGVARDTDKKKGQAQDKYGGYASWSDLDDAEDDEQDYDSDGSSDMEGGFDDVEHEERLALRTAQKEDQEALAEEERLKREKEERKRKLFELSKSAAGKKKY